jgi:glycosyltransferase involved in cell wall biosynthesis
MPEGGRSGYPCTRRRSPLIVGSQYSLYSAGHTVKLLVLVPARNEADSLPGLVCRLRAAQADAALLVVDDASADGTAHILPGLGVRWLRLCEHTGVGGAIRAGLRYSWERGHDVVVRVDGDGQHPAGEIDRVLAPIRAGEADAVIGSRYREASGYRSAGWRRLAQRGLAAWVSVVTGRRITDPTSGFWAFGPRAVQFLATHHPAGYPEPELLLLLAHNGLRVAEVPIEMHERTAGRSSLTAVRLALIAGRTLVALLILPLRKTVTDASPE